MAIIIDGIKIAKQYRNNIKQKVASLRENGIHPKLAVIIVGDNRASKSYVNSKQKACLENGIDSLKLELPESITEIELVTKIKQLNNDNSIHGILVQLPLPNHINSEIILNNIAPEKDVDGFNPINVGKLSLGTAKLVPCTPLGIIKLIKHTNESISGKKALVIGRSNIVGKPIANLLLQENATVTIAHSKTKNLSDLISDADIIISCVGIAHIISGEENFKNTAIVIDVGNNYKNNKLVGDVEFDKVKEKVSYISPVPGGVGPMTITMLMYNTLKAVELQNKNLKL